MQLRGVSARAAAAALLLAFAAHAASARAEVRLLGLEAASDGGGTRIELRADGETPASEPFRLAAPSRLVLDLRGVVNASGRQRLDVGGRDVLRVRIGQHAGFLRIVLDLAGESVAAPLIEHGPRSLSLAFGEARLPAVAAEPPAPAAAPTEPVPAARAAPEPSSAESEFIRIYGIELQAGAEQDRVLVFAERALEAELVTLDAGTVELRLAGAVLEPSAARRVKPDVGGAVSEVLAFRPLSKGAPEVRIQIERSAGVEPTLSRRGAILAVEFPLPDGARNAGITLAFVDTELAEVVRGGQGHRRELPVRRPPARGRHDQRGGARDAARGRRDPARGAALEGLRGGAVARRRLAHPAHRRDGHGGAAQRPRARP